MHDLVIRGGNIVDGTGLPRRVADVAVDNGIVTIVGTVADAGQREIDATGLLVTPGFVDIHTHYDGQVSWDPFLSPSCWHGVTTVVMGNCGVGFAPVVPGYREKLINIMEGVEDIPGTALTEGITWEWETFPQYLDALSAKSYAMDVGAQIPHAAVRTYVMGDRGGDNAPATAAEIASMASLVGEGMAAGAFGFTTSRISAHRTADNGVVPGTQVAIDEMEGIGAALGRAGHGIFEVVSDLNFDPIPGSLNAEQDMAWMADVSKRHGVTFTYLLHQNPGNPDQWKSTMQFTDAARARGGDIVPQITMRPIGMIMGWQSSFHIFMGRPTYDALAGLPAEELAQRLADTSVRAAILGEKSGKTPFEGVPIHFPMMFRLEQPNGFLNYEPSRDDSIEAIAAREDKTEEAVVYDMMMEKAGNGYVYVVLVNYGDYNLDFLYQLVNNPNTVCGGSDAGAHCGAICDAAMPTFMLSYWTRDRTAGPRLSVEAAVKRQTRDTARFYGMNDRGVLAPGMKADINVIDYERLDTTSPYMLRDLPAGGKRLVQQARGYVATIVSGVVTFENGEATGALPGRLLRSGPHAFEPANLAA